MASQPRTFCRAGGTHGRRYRGASGVHRDGATAPEHELVRSCRTGEPQSIAALVGRYQNAVFAVALSHLGCRQDAEDVVQDTFMTAVRKLDTLQNPERLGSWLCGIARHKALNLATRRRATLSWDAAALSAATAGPGCGVADLVAAAEVRHAVWSAIADLSPLQREAIILHHMRGYGVGEMARLLGVPVGTVKRRLHDARHRLKGELWHMVGEELRQSTPSDDLGARIQRALEKARAASRDALHAEALHHSAEALELIGGLPEDLRRTELQIQALNIKAQAVTFPVGGREAMAIEEQVLGLLEGLGDQRRIAEHLNQLGVRYANQRDAKRAAAAQRRALELYVELGNRGGQGVTLMWLGHLHLDDLAEPTEALACFERALPLLQGGEHHAEEAVCLAHIRALKGLGCLVPPDGMKVYDAVCDWLETRPDGVHFVAQPGFGFTHLEHQSEGALAIDILQSAGQARMLVGSGWHPGETWQAPAFSYTMRPLQLTATVLADDESLTIAAGTFDHCLHLRLRIVPDPEDEGSEFNRRLNLGNCGEKHI